MTTAASRPRSAYTRKNPFQARVLENRVLSGTGSGKETRHLVFDLAESGITYEVGDGVCVRPVNAPELVDLFLARLGVDGDTPITGIDPIATSREEVTLPLRHLLTYCYELSTPTREIIEYIAEETGDEDLDHLINTSDRAAMEAYLWGRDVLDVLNTDPVLALDLREVLGKLRPLQYRTYSIASSPQAHPGELHATVAVVRYRAAGRNRGGAATTFLADRHLEESAAIFISANRTFRLPADDATDLILIGPGTGIAPFRGFLHERRRRAAAGRNWLFFGDRQREHDFIYAAELEEFVQDGTLYRLDTAFSRDQREKVYVQERMRAQGKELFEWIEGGASIYVCGDAARMAPDVDEALHEIVAEQGAMTPDDADDYLNRLRTAKRYLRDVY